MKIENFIERDWDETIATFDLITSDGFKIKDCRLRKGKRGFFTSMPAEKRDGKWYDSVSTNEELNEKVTQLALDEIKESQNYDNNKVLKKSNEEIEKKVLNKLPNSYRHIANYLKKVYGLIDFVVLPQGQLNVFAIPSNILKLVPIVTVKIYDIISEQVHPEISYLMCRRAIKFLGENYYSYEVEIEGSIVDAYYPPEELEENPMMSLIVFLRSLGLHEDTGLKAGSISLDQELDGNIVENCVNGMIDLFEKLLKEKESINKDEIKFKKLILDKLSGTFEEKKLCYDILCENLENGLLFSIEEIDFDEINKLYVDI